MGCSLCGSKAQVDMVEIRCNLGEGVRNAQARCGRAAVAGRYHRSPFRLEDDYIVDADKVLGKGYSGSVLQAVHKGSGLAYAVKAFALHGLSKTEAQLLRAEAEIYLGMDHPHIARLVDVYEETDRLSLVMECMSGGELFQRIQDKGRFTEQDTAKCVSQMLRAINYLHSHGVVHRDVKLQNFLYEAVGSDHLKLIDFGFSQLWKPEDTTMKAFVGTLSYMAPEVLHFRARYTSQCDLWSMGVVTFALLTGRMPFNGTEPQQIKDIKAGNFKSGGQTRWDVLSPVAKDFVARLLTVQPKVRMTAAQALQHRFIKDCNHVSETNARKKVEPAIVNALVGFSKASQLRRAVMEVMAWSLSSEEQAAVREHFVRMDKSGQGTITLKELTQALTECGIDEHLVEPIFQALDGAKNDEIHYSEFLAAMVSTRIAMHEDMLKSTFRRFDTNNSGYITVENLKELLGDSFDGVPMEELLKEADFEKNNKISYDEFVHFLSADPAAMESTPVKVNNDYDIVRTTSDKSRVTLRQHVMEIIDHELENQFGSPKRGASFLSRSTRLTLVEAAPATPHSPRSGKSNKSGHSSPPGKKIKKQPRQKTTWLSSVPCCLPPLRGFCSDVQGRKISASQKKHLL
mmetsp:Transcript_92816/g.194002  ORF Transcript_92816/g.194002 Transcript_92816/m.194002 type:complete len:629 (-) Transcript_92816:329-2215(-)